MKSFALLCAIVWPALCIYSREIKPRYDVELRAGRALVCGTCGTSTPWSPTGATNLLLLSAMPLIPISAGRTEAGWYLKAANVGSGIQGAGGFLFGLDAGSAEILGFVGVAYMDRRLTDKYWHYITYMGQTRHTYDLGISLRVPLVTGIRLTGTYNHNSNGSAIGLNVLKGKGANPGIDSVLLGVAVSLP